MKHPARPTLPRAVTQRSRGAARAFADEGAIGILDWGIGGLGLYALLRRAHPGVPVVYVSDAGSTPYGRLAPDRLADRVASIARWLRAHGVARLAIACNAASTVLPRLGIPGLAGVLATPHGPLAMTGVIAHAIALVRGTSARTVGVVGGRRTILSGVYRRHLETRGRTIVQRVAQPLSAHIEAGALSSPALERDLRRILAPLARVEVDALLLACTHYPAISDRFAAHLPGAKLLDPAAAMADWIGRTWLDSPGSGSDRFFTSGDQAQMRRAAWAAFCVRLGRIQRLGA